MALTYDVSNVNRVREQSHSEAAEVGWWTSEVCTLLKVTKKPFSRPMSRRPKSNTQMAPRYIDYYNHRLMHDQAFRVTAGSAQGLRLFPRQSCLRRRAALEYSVDRAGSIDDVVQKRGVLVELTCGDSSALGRQLCLVGSMMFGG